MRINFLLPTVNMSGGVRVVVIYARILASRGHRVTLVSPPARQPDWKEKLKSLLQGRGWPRVDAEPASHLDGSGLEHHVLDRWRPIMDHDLPDADVSIATWWETAEWLNRLSPAKGAKVYFIQHHEVFDYLPQDRCRATYRMPLHKIVIARWLQRVMQEEYRDAMTDLVPNSVDHDQFFAAPRNKQSRPTVGFLFSYADFKGVDITLQAIEKLRSDFPDLRVISFGTARPEQVTHWHPDIEFHFSPAQDMLRDLYASCDVWMTASRSEGFNLPAMEAMACHTPVVSTRTGWPEEAIQDGVNGYLCAIDDIEGMAVAASRILSSAPEAWVQLSQAACDTVATGSWEQSAKLFEQALQRACERAAAHALSDRITERMN